MHYERLKGILFNILFNPAFIALPVALIVIWAVPDVYDKYTIKPISEKILSAGTNIEYYDLDHDGISEWYSAGGNGIKGSAIAIRNQLGVFFHWDFDGEFMPNRQKCIVGDANNDGIDEIYAFTIKGDSLLINGIDYGQKGKFSVKNRLIGINPRVNGNINFGLLILKITDLTGDGYKELVFALSSGYGFKPRRVFALDIKNDSLYTSPELGGHIGPFDMADIDGDGKDEIAVTNYGPGNIHDRNLTMQDTSAYVIVLDNNLQFLFPPIASPGTYNGIYNRFLRSGGKYNIVSYWGYNSQIPGEPSLKIYNIQGRLLSEHYFPVWYRLNPRFLYVLSSKSGTDKIILAPNYDKIEVFDTKLRSLKKPNLLCGNFTLELFDFDQDGETELLSRGAKPDEWFILRNTLKDQVKLNIPSSNMTPFIYTILQHNQKPQFCLQINDRQYVFEYGFNTLYYWQYPVYMGIYLGVLLFIFFIQRILKFQLQKKYETEKRIAELQYISLQNQISPHFTFNVLNTIGSAINQENKDDAYQLLVKFSKLLRALLTNPETVTRTLKEELEFVANFLEIQKHRFRDVFTYEIDLDQKVNTDLLLPKSCIQTYVENALKHGIVPLKQNGLIKIAITHKEKYLEIRVTDNGIGRADSAKTSSTSTGRGLKIMHQYYELFNKANKEPITEEFTDLKDTQDKATGTEVTIRIPDDFKFSFVTGSTK